MNASGIRSVNKFGQYPNTKGIISTPSLTLRTITCLGETDIRQLFFNTVLQTKIYLDGSSAGIGISSNQLNIFTPTSWTTNFQVGSTVEFTIDSTGISIPNGNLTFENLATVDAPVTNTITSIKYYWANPFITIPYNTTFFNDYTFTSGHRSLTIMVHYMGTKVGLQFPTCKFISGATVFSTNYFGVTQGMSSSTPHTTGDGILLWENSWSTAHIISGCLTVQYAGLLDTVTEPKSMWVYYGTIKRVDSDFQATVYGTFLHNSTQPITKFRIQTDAATDRFGLNPGNFDSEIAYLTH
jgi:hypothetical protein